MNGRLQSNDSHPFVIEQWELRIIIILTIAYDLPVFDSIVSFHPNLLLAGTFVYVPLILTFVYTSIRFGTFSEGRGLKLERSILECT